MRNFIPLVDLIGLLTVSGRRSFAMNFLTSIKGKKKKPNKDATTQSLRMKKTKEKKDEGGRSIKVVRKDKAAVDNSKKVKKVKKPAKPKNDHTKGDDDDEDKEEEPPRTVPAFFGEPTEEQKKAYAAFAKCVFQIGVEGLKAEYTNHVKTYTAQPMQRAIFDQNPKLNRYKDIICNDLTRVVLNDGRGGDYIHGNWVRGEPIFNEFICTQGPTPATLIDFWRMIMHTKSYNIIMLCDTVENDKFKCEQYWPREKGEKMTFGDITVEHVTKNTKDTHVTKTVLRASVGDVVHTVRHHQWKTWPDRSFPKSTKAVLRILRAVRPSCRPVVVHCSAGIGRTGTFVAVEMCLQKLLGSLSLNEIAKRLRNQRAKAVQEELQYVYLAVAVLEYGKAMEYWMIKSFWKSLPSSKGRWSTWPHRRTRWRQECRSDQRPMKYNSYTLENKALVVHFLAFIFIKMQHTDRSSFYIASYLFNCF